MNLNRLVRLGNAIEDLAANTNATVYEIIDVLTDDIISQEEAGELTSYFIED